MGLGPFTPRPRPSTTVPDRAGGGDPKGSRGRRGSDPRRKTRTPPPHNSPPVPSGSPPLTMDLQGELLRAGDIHPNPGPQRHHGHRSTQGVRECRVRRRRRQATDTKELRNLARSRLLTRQPNRRRRTAAEKATEADFQKAKAEINARQQAKGGTSHHSTIRDAPIKRSRITIATLNLQGKLGRAASADLLATSMAHHGIDIAAIQETALRHPHDGGYDFGKGRKYRIFAAQSTESHNGVGWVVAADKRLKVRAVTPISDRISVLQWEPQPGITMSLVGAYAPTEDTKEAPEVHERRREEFWDLVEATVAKQQQTKRGKDRVVLLGDFNATAVDGNRNDERLSEVAASCGLSRQNLRWRQAGQETWKGNAHQTLKTIDWFLYPNSRAKEVLGCRAANPRLWETDHRMVRADIRLPGRGSHGPPRAVTSGRRQIWDPGGGRPMDQGGDLDQQWEGLRRKLEAAAATPPQQGPKKDWIAPTTWDLIQKKEAARLQLSAAATPTPDQTKAVAVLTKAVRKATRRDSRLRYERLGQAVDEAWKRGDSATTFKLLRPWYRRTPRNNVVRTDEVKDGIVDHFKQLFNSTDAPPIPPAILPTPMLVEILPPPPLPPEQLTITAYTDGGCEDNGKDSATAAWGVWFGDTDKRNDYGKVPPGDTPSNIRGEVCAVWQALQKTPPGATVTIWSDWEGIKAGLTNSMGPWQADDFGGIHHGDIWREVAKLAQQRHIKIQWVKSHQDLSKLSGEDLVRAYGNQEVDKLATKGIKTTAATRIPALPPSIPIPPHEWPDGVPTAEEVEIALAQVRNTSPGIDGIRAATLRADKALVGELAALIQAAWRQGRVPRAWGEAVVVAIPKKPGAVDPKDHRGITLLATASKVLARIIYRRVSAAPLLDMQHGFRRGRNTIGPIAVLKNVAQQCLKVCHQLVVLFVDAEKAYDNIDRETMWSTLPRYGFGPNTITMIRALYEDRLCVKVDGELRGSFSTSRGVRQGCLLSPLLFNIMLDHSIRGILPSMHGMAMQAPDGTTTCIKVAAYADDIAIFAPSTAEMQHDFNLLASAMAAIGLTISIGKTKVIIFDRQGCNAVSSEAYNTMRTRQQGAPGGTSRAMGTTGRARGATGRARGTTGRARGATGRARGAGRAGGTAAGTESSGGEEESSTEEEESSQLDQLLGIPGGAAAGSAAGKAKGVYWNGQFNKWVVDKLPTKCGMDGCPYMVTETMLLRKHLQSRHKLKGAKVAMGSTIAKRISSLRVTNDGTVGTCIREEGGQIFCSACGGRFKLMAYAKRHEREKKCPAAAASVAPPPLETHTKHPSIPQAPPPPPKVAAPITPITAYGAAAPQAGAAQCKHTDKECPSKARCTHACCKVVEQVPHFKYLGRIVTADDKDEMDVKRRVKSAREAFHALAIPVFKNKCASRKTRIVVAEIVCKSILTYAAETWVLKDADRARIDRLQQSILRRCLGMHPVVTKNAAGQKTFRHPKATEILAAANQAKWSTTVNWRQAQWFGHVLRMPSTNMVPASYTHSRHGTAYMGHKSASMLTHRMEAGMKECNLQKEDAKDRGKWQRAIRSLAPGCKTSSSASGGTGPHPTARQPP